MVPKDLDGTPEQFPHRGKAIQAYRRCWFLRQDLYSQDFPLSDDLNQELEALEKKMDKLQELISHGPGPLWMSFYADLVPEVRKDVSYDSTTMFAVFATTP